MNNAMNRDLARLVARVEQLDGPNAQKDPYRLKFHLMPPVGWLNDPNGLCKFRDEYHVFFQYGPFDATGGVKHWGHYKSQNLIDWEYLPPMLYPDESYDVHGAYSGSVYVEDDKMYLYYTGNIKHTGDYDYIKNGRGNNTCLAISEDGLQPISKQCLMENKDYPQGLSCHVRDPKVWRQDDTYYMVLGARTLQDRGEVLIFESKDKQNWSHCNTITTPQPFGYMWECPDLFELDGQWFLAVSPQGVEQTGDCYQNVYACGYFPLYGDFHGECSLGEFHAFDKGFDFYAPQSFLDGQRRIQFGWMGMPDADYTNPTVQNGWQHCLTVPCELTARDGRILRNPVQELEALRGTKQMISVQSEASVCASTFDLVYEPQGAFELVVHDCVALSWDNGVLRMRLVKGGAGRTERVVHMDSPNKLRILADVSAVEIFINDGAEVLSTRCYPDAQQGICWKRGQGQATLWEIK